MAPSPTSDFTRKPASTVPVRTGGRITGHQLDKRLRRSQAREAAAALADAASTSHGSAAPVPSSSPRKPKYSPDSVCEEEFMSVRREGGCACGAVRHRL